MRLRAAPGAALIVLMSQLGPSATFVEGLSAQATRAVTVDIGARDPAVSPDGSKIALSILGKIWTIPSTGGEATQITWGPGWDTRPAWSPDGRFLAYAGRGASGTDLIIRNLATGASRYLHRGPAAIGQIAFDPSGGRIYFINDLSQYDAHLWRIGLDGDGLEQLTFTQNWHEWSFAITPDGRRAVLESGRYGGADLYELDLENGTATRLTSTPAREMSVALSPSGDARAHVETHDGVDHVVVTDSDGSERRPHTSPFDQKQLAYGPDGALYVAGGRRLMRLDTETGATTPIPFEARFRLPSVPVDDLLITNVRLFDATSDEVVEAASVWVRDGRIAEIGPDVAPPATDTVVTIDGAGRTLLPGLLDNHYHYWSPHAGADLLAAGITTIRDPGSQISDAMDYKDAIRLGIASGPEIFTAGPLIDGPGGYHPLVDVSIEDPAAAAPLVRAFKAQGVDLLKVYFQLDRDVMEAVIAEARVQGLPVTGHIGVRASWEEAIDAGIDGFNHIRVWRDFLDPAIQVDGRDESLDGGRNPIGRMQADWREIDPESPRVRALLARMAETRTALDPTLFIQGIEDRATAPGRESRNRTRFSLEQFGTAAQSFERMKTFVRLAVEAGVPLLAGTDNVSLFDELEAYAEAGVANADILRAATINGARWLGRDAEFGTVEVGKRAHLILVDGDPLADIAELREIDLVIKDGVVVFRR